MSRQALRGAHSTGSLSALMLIDLDRFKEVNDTLGHDHGDALLREVAQRLSEVLRPSDTLARLGGDEFAILLRDLPHRGAIAEVTARIQGALERPFELCGVAVELGASIGVALYPDHGEDLTTLLRRADVAMYDAKSRRDGVRTYEPARDPYSPERLALVGELRRAIQSDELVLHFQPKIAIDSGELAGVEALVRWNHPERGLIPPVEFIPLAERTGMAGAVTDWVLASALGAVRALARRGHRASGRGQPLGRRRDGRSPGRARRRRARRRRAARRHAAVRDLRGHGAGRPAARDREPQPAARDGRPALARRLRQGQSSMGYLKRLPLDQIKIDRSFVMGMSADESDAAIVRTTIDLGRNLGLEVVAEGVETDEVLSDLAALRCDIAQGFGLSRPLPADELERWLDARGVSAGSA